MVEGGTSAAEADERRPLLSRLYTDHGENGDPIYSCRTDPHSHLPVYTNIHRIRRDIISVVEDYLSLQQLTDVRLNVTVVRPLVDKFYDLEDISIGRNCPSSSSSSPVPRAPTCKSVTLFLLLTVR